MTGRTPDSAPGSSVDQAMRTFLWPELEAESALYHLQTDSYVRDVSWHF
jgi:hypothetical protein